MTRTFILSLLLLTTITGLQSQEASSIETITKHIHVPSPEYVAMARQVASQPALKFSLNSIIISDELVLKLEHIPNDLEVSILKGKVAVLHVPQDENEPTTTIRIDLEHLTHGAYTLQLKSAGQVYTKRIVKT